MTVYERMLKLTTDTSMGEKMAVIYTAVLNLATLEDIRSFTNDYIKHHRSTAKNDIPYILSFAEIEDRKLWHSAVGDIVNISILYNRDQRELYRFFLYVDADGNDLPPYENKEKGYHQSM